MYYLFLLLLFLTKIAAEPPYYAAIDRTRLDGYVMVKLIIVIKLLPSFVIGACNYSLTAVPGSPMLLLALADTKI